MSSLGFEPTPSLLLILPVLLLITAAILDFIFNKSKSALKKKDVTSQLDEHRNLYKGLDISFAENIEKKLNSLIEQGSGVSAPTGLAQVKEAMDFYRSRIKDISAYARNPVAFGYEFASNISPHDIIRTYEAKVKDAQTALEKVETTFSEETATEQRGLMAKNIEGIKEELSKAANTLKSIIQFERDKFPEIEAALKDTGGEAGQNSLIPLIPAALGILIGLYAVVTAVL